MNNKKEIYLNFGESGLPRGTAQQKGERVILKNGKPVILHYKKDNVERGEAEFIHELRPHRPPTPYERPLRLVICFYFDIKRRKLWGSYKDTRPDLDNYAKTLIDSLGACGYFRDDAQIVDLRLVKYYAEKASIYIRLEELGDD